MKKTIAATALIAALSAAGSVSAMTFMDQGGEFVALASDLTNEAKSPNRWATEIRGNQDGPTVRVVALSDFGAAGQALNSYLDNNAVDLSEFHRAVDQNAKISAKLFGTGYGATDVVAFKSVGSNDIQLIVDDIR